MTTFTGRAADAAETPHVSQGRGRWRTILKRALQFSFLFFLHKGLAWLAVGFLAWRGLT
jgi:hypothetical protein